MHNHEKLYLPIKSKIKDLYNCYIEAMQNTFYIKLEAFNYYYIIDTQIRYSKKNIDCKII